MKIYLVVEGEIGEKKVYAKWIKYYRPNLKIIHYLDELVDNSVFIISGMGYPNYFEVIENAALDVYENKIDKLVVAIDSEDMTYREKFNEIQQVINSLHFKITYNIIIQHFCLETWALGNKVIVPRQPKNSELKTFRRFFDILNDDPALLPPYEPKNLNRAQFAELYLRRLLNDKYRNLTYSKRNPSALLHVKYFRRVVDRFRTTGHISSFNDFLKAFQ